MEPEEIYSIFYEKDNRSKINSADEFIRTYEANKEQIESHENHFYERIKIEYAIILGYNEEYKRALPLLTTNIELMLHPNFDNPLMVTEGYLKTSRFLKAQSLYYTKNLNQAKVLFSELHKEYPNNDIYKNWVKSSIHWKFQKSINYLYLVAGISFIIHMILLRFETSNWELAFLIIGIGSLITTAIFSLLSKFKQKKIK